VPGWCISVVSQCVIVCNSVACIRVACSKLGLLDASCCIVCVTGVRVMLCAGNCTVCSSGYVCTIQLLVRYFYAFDRKYVLLAILLACCNTFVLFFA